MKEIDELNLPEDLNYTEDHEWARSEQDKVRVGISDYAQDQLGDIVFVELPQAGVRIEKGKELGTVESVKTVSELYMPVSGEVLSFNAALEDAPELLNDDPYGAGWMIEVKPDNPAELDSLLNKQAYLEFLQGIE